MTALTLGSPVHLITGVGPKRKKILEESGFLTVQQLLYLFPRRYLDRNFTQDLLWKEGSQVTLLGVVTDSYLAHGKRSRLLVGFRTQNNQKIQLVFFQSAHYFQKVFSKDKKLIVSGKLESFRGFQIVHPEVEFLSDEDELDPLHSGRIIPLYSTTEAWKKEGLDSRGLRRIIRSALDDLLLNENLPIEMVQSRGLLDRSSAMNKVHFPDNDEDIKKARTRFAYEELFYFQLLILQKQKQRSAIPRILWPLPKSKSRDQLLNSLPFELTEDQSLAIDRLLELSKEDMPWAALLQGDVGCGKTITSLLLALHYVDNNIQVAYLAPTEILARQHYQSIYKFLGNLPFLGIELLLGGENKVQRLEKLFRIKSGESSIIIGTHALLQEDVEFQDLGLVVIDEQHKFGVNQRETIRSKGKNPDILAMTATPIPRTLCLTMYGDLELVTIKTKPKGRKPIDTRWFLEEKRQGVYNSIRKYMNEGRQCYIVYPLVEESEKIDLESCTQAHQTLKSQIFTEFQVGLLHGKMKSSEKDNVMRLFKKGEIQILVTTTVVEVGVDVPNATILVVEHADRFGLSQLHQLRGRVGRSDLASFCILLTGTSLSQEAKQRIEALVSTNDGYVLSEKDLEIRGPGEVLGLRQSGLPEFRIADLIADRPLVELAREDAIAYQKWTNADIGEIQSRFEEGKFLFAN